MSGSDDRAGQWITTSGIVMRGHRVASGLATDNRYPRGALDMQQPFFKERGLDLAPYYAGTLNISIRPLVFTMHRPRYTFRQVEWTSLHPPEDFSFSECAVVFNAVRYAGWVYYPHPETKRTHFQDPSIVEVITTFVPNIAYGDRVDVLLDGAEISVGPAL